MLIYLCVLWWMSITTLNERLLIEIENDKYFNRTLYGGNNNYGEVNAFLYIFKPCEHSACMSLHFVLVV